MVVLVKGSDKETKWGVPHRFRVKLPTSPFPSFPFISTLRKVYGEPWEEFRCV